MTILLVKLCDYVLSSCNSTCNNPFPFLYAYGSLTLPLICTLMAHGPICQDEVIVLRLKNNYSGYLNSNFQSN